MANNYHIPVMLQPCIDGLNIKPDGVYVDVTFGGGGHSREILKHLGPKGRLIAFDQDPDAQANVPADDRFIFIDQNFGFLKNNLRLKGFKQVDGILADLGVSSHQFDVPQRGFSIRHNADLDMRMDQHRDLTAAEILNTYTEDKLHKIFGIYGEVKNAKSLARAIVTSRLEQPFSDIDSLKSAIAGYIPKGKENKYLAQVFQALRIEVNAEIQVLEDFLLQAADVLKPGGHLVVMSYHSLEDRPVKNFMAKGKFQGEVEKDFFGNQQKPFNVITRKAIIATDEEIAQNNRARSAKLRIAEKI
ncbi:MULTISPECIES: 16S rRNA (cytosine(1402)-N(4))-methyltransferase RsmH [unclassified Pedobacter]|jgi:16S rRNA (cytosine1402-N4)-methyltransferase|uniref:16S rRNA (cytosine(1402)-N(4))-methyltransferase RsmH n=1 Tax=unclassified Pedobacter TaxID=2628915 RepID=UPI001D8676F5|nr:MULTISPECIES: 16S rRNA (cytosine(1402)-N(4))-methyltransferase RsmH [unclassified Pedobacter]CAH0164965.1 Ribosomal RNA small subunit methyltransferase H [Pedobacter sp. Bi126]CAH0283701.1 Ribosomal RNA small subunit methyltransferase H [Pedobacter sp. Bi36]